LGKLRRGEPSGEEMMTIEAGSKALAADLAVVTIMVLSAQFWIAEAKADKISLCFATEKFVCSNNGHGSSSFVKKTELEVKTMSEISARKAAEGFCKSGKEIKKTTSTGNGVYYLYEADCDKK
jgi:hypothetical protein